MLHVGTDRSEFKFRLRITQMREMYNFPLKKSAEGLSWVLDAGHVLYDFGASTANDAYAEDLHCAEEEGRDPRTKKENNHQDLQGIKQGHRIIYISYNASRQQRTPAHSTSATRSG